MRIDQLLADGAESGDVGEQTPIDSADRLGSVAVVEHQPMKESTPDTRGQSIKASREGQNGSRETTQREQQQRQWGLHPGHLTRVTHVPVGYQLMLVPTETLSRWHSNTANGSSRFNAWSVPSSSPVVYPVGHHITAFNPLSRHLLPSPAGSESSDTNCNLDTLAELALVGPAVSKVSKTHVQNGAPHIENSNPQNLLGRSKTTHALQYRQELQQQVHFYQQTSVQGQSQNYYRTPQEQSWITPKDILLAPIDSNRKSSADSFRRNLSDRDCDEGTTNKPSKKRKSSDSSFISAPSPSTSSYEPHSITTMGPLQASTSSLLPSPTEVPTGKELERRHVCPHYGQPKAKHPKYGDHGRKTVDQDDLICYAKFRRRQEMERHLASVHGSEEDKGWVCPGPVSGKGCGKRYARADALRKHLVSSRSRNVADGCSYGLTEDDIVSMVRRGATAKRL
ncbi:hypothetical protein CcCBS67573_g05824 [Chytriomyces confervae]|uniref:Uncharacterized protein n=1 Tax=Chytriomyces confervae TaxID=246404 RepID=A0A507FB55_9FUNG|nr:hypothetical protein CcCBS67573_g05824 [Chytriomyces confervae]